MAVALIALDAVIRTKGSGGERSIPITDFFVSYGVDPARENVLMPGELVTAVQLPPVPWFSQSRYVKARDRASYEFALASAATAISVDRGVISDCRIALGGVATKPWRAYAAEAVLKGRKPNAESFEMAAAAELQAATPQKDNAFKVPMVKRVLVHALQLSSIVPNVHANGAMGDLNEDE